MSEQNEQTKDEQLSEAQKYPLCSRWAARDSEIRHIMQFLEWLCEGAPSDYSDEGHNFTICDYGRYETLPIDDDASHVERFGQVLVNAVEGAEQFIPVGKRPLDLIYEYLGVNPSDLEKERAAILDEMRKANEKAN